MQIEEFCDSCGKKEEFIVISIHHCENGYKEVTLQCTVCGKIIKKNMML